MKVVQKQLLAAAALALAAGCGGGAAESPGEIDAEALSPPPGFSWVVPGELAAMPVPGRDRPLEMDISYLETVSIGTLVSLTEVPVDRDLLTVHGITGAHLPVEDFHPPSLQQMIEFVAVVDASLADGRPVGVHCTAGLGRSGTMAAAYLVSRGSTADEAMATVRELRPGSIETPEQEDAIRKYETHRTEEHP